MLYVFDRRGGEARVRTVDGYSSGGSPVSERAIAQRLFHRVVTARNSPWNDQWVPVNIECDRQWTIACGGATSTLLSASERRGRDVIQAAGLVFPVCRKG